ncbi:MAG TPA: hypothetical protein VI542_28840 [Candidatus Tectomicrobia bacterium]
MQICCTAILEFIPIKSIEATVRADSTQITVDSTLVTVDGLIRE